MNRGVLAGLAAAALLACAGGARGATLVLPRAGQVGIDVQGQYGSLLQTGQFGREFGPGPGMAVRLRYRMRYERGIGLSFEENVLDSRSPRHDKSAFLAAVPPDATDRKSFQVTSEAFDLYQFFGTRTKWTSYVTGTMGIAQLSGKLADGEIVYPQPKGTDAMLIGGGAGVERFVYRSWAVDVNVQYRALLYDRQVNSSLHAAVGMVFYAAY